VLELLIMRHAKSDWGAGAAHDRDRPLARRGVKAAKRMGKVISKIGVQPELVLSSPAVRAAGTAELAARAGHWTASTKIVPSFYGGSWADVVYGVRAEGGGFDRVLVVGHEPTWSTLTSVLLGGAQLAMPTGAVACVEVLGPDWSVLGPECGELRWLITPRMVGLIT
jgi:phosphohistidine phosphatase